MDVRPTTVLLSGGPCALNVYCVVTETGLRISEDLFVVGFGRSLSQSMYPPLATVNQMTDELVLRLRKC